MSKIIKIRQLIDAFPKLVCALSAVPFFIAHPLNAAENFYNDFIVKDVVIQDDRGVPEVVSTVSGDVVGSTVRLKQLQQLMTNVRKAYLTGGEVVRVSFAIDKIEKGVVTFNIAHLGPNKRKRIENKTLATSTDDGLDKWPPHIAQKISAEHYVKEVIITGADALDARDIDEFKNNLIGKKLKLESILGMMQQIKASYAHKELQYPVINLSLDKLTPEKVYITVTEVAAPKKQKKAAVKKVVYKAPKHAAKNHLVETEPRIFLLKENALKSKFAVGEGLRKVAPRIFIFKDAYLQKRQKEVLLKAAKKESDLKKAREAQLLAAKPATTLSKIVAQQVQPVEVVDIPDPMSKATTIVSKVEKNGIEFVERGDDDLLVLDVVIDAKYRAGSVVAYMDEGELLLPITSIFEMVGFPIDVLLEEGHAEGWFMEEGRNFSLDLRSKHLEINKEIIDFPEHGVEAQYDDIYVWASHIQDWLPFELNLNYSDLTLMLQTDSELPFQQKDERRVLWERLEKQNNVANVSETVVHLPYSLAAKPAIRASIQSTYSKQPAGESFVNTATLQARGDFLGTSANIVMSALRDNEGNTEIKNFNTKFVRSSPEGNIFGKLKTTNLELGDINLPSVPLLSLVDEGRGIYFNNRPVGYVDDPDNFVIRGNAPIGWDVEVYQDQMLLDFQSIGDDGEYQFLALPLKRGLNIFRVISYGPNGEKDQTVQKFYLGSGMVKKGKFYYDIAAIESVAPLWSVEDNIAIPSNDEASALLRGEYGVSKNLSVIFAGYKGMLGAAQNGNAFLGGVRGSLEDMYYTTDILNRNDGARSLNITGRKSLFDSSSILATYTRNDGYLLSENKRKNDISLRFEQMLNYWHHLWSYSLEGHFRTTAANIKEVLFKNRITTTFYGYNLSNQLTYEEELNSDRLKIVEGEIIAKRRFDLVNFRGKMNYTIGGEKPGVNSFSLRGQKALSDKISLQVYFNQDLDNEESNHTDLDTSLNWITKNYAIALNTGVRTDGSYTLGLNLSSYIHPTDSKKLSYGMDGRNTGFSLANVTVRAFVDANSNNVYDEGEELLENVAFRNRKRGNESYTNIFGEAIVDELTPFVKSPIEIVVDTLPDIYFSPSIPAIHVVSHAGAGGVVDFPIVILGEITGTLYANDGHNIQLLPDAVVQLVNSKGEVVNKTYSEYDGYYSFADIKMGAYTVRVNQVEFGGAIHEMAVENTVELTASEPVQDGRDLAVELTISETGASSEPF